jgi:ADP-ribosyl-[dinitrogen reductase] hydrolase
MRIAPIAFIKEIPKEQIREICFITHSNDEAYVGALSVIIAIKSILSGSWTGRENLLEIIIDQIPDTRVRDRLIEIDKISNKLRLKEIGKLGNSGYVVDSVPMAITAASRINELGLEKMFIELIEIDGDTDTNCSIAGQIGGALIGIDGIPEKLLNKLKELSDYKWIKETITKLNKNKKWV